MKGELNEFSYLKAFCQRAGPWLLTGLVCNFTITEDLLFYAGDFFVGGDFFITCNVHATILKR